MSEKIDRVEQKDFNTQELARFGMIGLYEMFVLEQREKLGETATKSMLTVVQHHTPPAPSDATRAVQISGSYEVLEGLTLPDTFEPAETSEIGYGDRVFFLKEEEAAPVVDERGKSFLIANTGGSPKKVRNTPRQIKKLTKQGVEIQSSPLARPQTKKMLQFLAPNM